MLNTVLVTIGVLGISILLLWAGWFIAKLWSDEKRLLAIIMVFMPIFLAVTVIMYILYKI